MEQTGITVLDLCYLLKEKLKNPRGNKKGNSLVIRHNIQHEVIFKAGKIVQYQKPVRSILMWPNYKIFG